MAWCAIGAVGGAVAVGVALVRARYLRWGATDEELEAGLPGDELVGAVDLTATRAVSVGAGADVGVALDRAARAGTRRVLQLRLPRKLVGLRHPQRWAGRRRMAVDRRRRRGTPSSRGRPDRRCRGAGARLGPAWRCPDRRMAPPYDFTWAFVLRDHTDGSTRLVVRERYGYSRRWACLLVEPVELISFVMSRRMLRGIKERAERPLRCAPTLSLIPAKPTTPHPTAGRP